jgi:hypothetical protein
MRTIAHIALTTVLLLAVTGVSVQTHYCGGTARYATIAMDNEATSCCGDDMPACPSCKDEVTSNVLTTPLSLVAQADGSALFAARATVTAVLPCAVSMESTAHAITFDTGPPGVTRGSTIPILVSSFLI